jgi:hypothetical protein
MAPGYIATPDPTEQMPRRPTGHVFCHGDELDGESLSAGTVSASRPGADHCGSCLGRWRPDAPLLVLWLQLKDDAECGVDSTDLVSAEIAHARAETARVDSRSLFSKNPRRAAFDLHLGSKARVTR